MASDPSLRSRITRAFSDEDLRAICFDRFPAVYREFAVGMTTGQMVQILLDHCVRHNAGDALLTALEQERPGLIGPDRDALLVQLEAHVSRGRSLVISSPPPCTNCARPSVISSVGS